MYIADKHSRSWQQKIASECEEYHLVCVTERVCPDLVEIRSNQKALDTILKTIDYLLRSTSTVNQTNNPTENREIKRNAADLNEYPG